MRLLGKYVVFTTCWSTARHRPSIIRHVRPKPSFIVGVSFWGWAIIRRSWWNQWTKNGKLAANDRGGTVVAPKKLFPNS